MRNYYLNLAREAFERNNMSLYYYYIWLARKEKED